MSNLLTNQAKKVMAERMFVEDGMTAKAIAEQLDVSEQTLSKWRKGKDGEKPLLKRLPLHFAKIRIVLPGFSETSVFQSPLPKDMEITLKQLRKYNRIF